MINTYSCFYYGFVVNSLNRYLDFEENDGTILQAEIDFGSYSFSTIGDKIAEALNTASTNQSYFVTNNRSDRTFTITSDNTFRILGSTGSGSFESILPDLGFDFVDTVLALSHTGTLEAGKAYFPQYKLQSYVPTTRNKKLIDANVNRSASGKIEVVKFGTENFMQCDIDWITNIVQDLGSPILTDPEGEQNATDFMDFIVEKHTIEFIPDVGDRDTFERLILETTPESDKGTSYILKEKYMQGLPHYWKTGILKFRKRVD